MRLLSLGLITSFLCLALLVCSDKTEQRSAPGTETETQTAEATPDQSDSESVTAPPVAMTQFVLDPQSGTIFKLNLATDSIAASYQAEAGLSCIAFDYMGRKLYKGFAGASPGLEIYDTKEEQTIKRIDFPEPVTAMLFDPLKRHLYIVSEDSTRFKDFNCDSLGMEQDFPLHVVDKGFIGPTTLQPGPAGKVITANGDRCAVTQVFTQNAFMYQTITNHLARRLDCAVFSWDGNSSYSCDTKAGAIYKVQFGSGEMQAQKDKLDRPRSVQIEVNSNTVVVVVGDNEVLMLNPDTFVETGRINLAEYGDEILSVEIPPKANFAEVLMDYKGVTRWLRFDVRTWENTRMIELI
ncbi:MAG: hypothetical protein ABIJ61_07610 [bacterium]